MSDNFPNKIATCEYNKRCKKVAVAVVPHKGINIHVCSDHFKKFNKK